MAAKISNDRQLKNLKAASKRYKVAVSSPAGGGLSVYVRPTGKKVFAFRYRWGDKASEVTLGTYPSTTLADARDLHAEAVGQLNEGHDPKLAREQRIEQNRLARTMSELFDEWIEHYSQVPSQKTDRVPTSRTVDNHRLNWRKHCGEFHRIRVSDVSKPRLVRFLSRVSRAHPVTSRHILNMFRMMLRYAESVGEIDINPAEAITAKQVHSSQGKMGDRWLSLGELTEFWNTFSCQESPLAAETIGALQLIVLTGARVSEVVGARFSEIDLESGKWSIPWYRTKSRRTHIIYLSSMAVQVIRNARQLSRSDFVFESSRGRGRPIWSSSVATGISRLLGYGKSKEDERNPEAALAHFEYFKVHDLRRTFATLQGEELGTEQSVIDKMLDHVAGSRLHQTYQHAQHRERQRNAWQAYSDLLAGHGCEVLEISMTTPDALQTVVRPRTDASHAETGESV